MIILVSNKIYIKHPPRGFESFLKKNYVIPNPEYITRVRLNKWIGKTPKTLSLYDVKDGVIILPYGCLRAVYIYIINCVDMTTVDIKTFLNRDATADWSGNDIIPRPYQNTAINAMLYHKFGILKAPCSSGKTIMGHVLAQRAGMNTLWLTHTQKLLEQSRAVGEQILGKLDGRVGTVTDGKVNWGSTITYATVQTMIKLDPSEYRDRFNCVIVDECFPATTTIETKDGIKTLDCVTVGDIITSYNTKTGKVENKPVTHVFKLKAHNIVTVVLSNGKRIVCTSNHPFYTQSGEWKKAEELGVSDYVMQLLPQGIYGKRYPEIEGVQLPKDGEMVLLDGMRSKRTKVCSLDRGTKKKGIRVHEEDKSGLSRSDYRPNEEQQPYEGSCYEKTGIQKAEGNRTSSKNKVRKWLRSYCSSANDDAGTRKDDGRICGVSVSNKDAERFWVSNVLQNRCGNTIGDDRRRSGRKHSLLTRTPSAGQEERRIFDWFRVESVQVQEPTSDGTFGGLCPDGYVYNIEVADNNNYFADGVLVHNCHRCNTKKSTSQMSFVVNNIAAEYKYGLSATPETLDGYGRTVFCNLGDVKYEIKKEELEDQNTIMPVDIYPIFTEWTYPEEAFRANGTLDFHEAVRYMAADPTRNKEITDLICGRPTLILSNNIDHLCYMANTLSEKQQERTCLVSTKHDENILKAKILCKHTPKATTEYIDKMRSGELDIMFATYQLAKEGLNIPRLEQVIMAFPAVDDNIITQTVGRVARTCEGKFTARCYDIVDRPTYFRKKWRDRKKLYKKNGNEIIGG